MKKIFVCAMAAIVALASCSKTELINTEAPKEIGFKAVTGSHTKVGEESGSLKEGTKLGVIAYVNGTSNLYFDNTIFEKDDTYWTGNKFWPLQSNLDFIVYAPYDANTSLDNTNNKIITVTASNVGRTSMADQTDYLYGAAFYDGDDNSNSGYDKNTTSVTTALNHALAKIKVVLNVKNVTINKVSLVSPTMSGSYTVDYTTTTANPAPVWTPDTPVSPATSFPDFEFTQLAGLTSTSTTEKSGNESIMVVPNTNATSLIIKYTIKGAEASLNANVSLNTGNNQSPAKWEHGTQYTYTINITPQEIQFDAPTVSSWTTGQGSTTTFN